jgi:hypothetical protein
MENKQNLQDGIDLPQTETKPKYNFYFRCRACDSMLNHNSYNVKNGIQESPYCSKCSSYAFDTSDSDREYEHQAVSDLYLGNSGGYENSFD